MGKLLGIFTRNIKAFSVIGALSGLVAILNYVDSNGYNRAVQEYTEINARALKESAERLTKKAYKEMQDALAKQAKVHRNELMFISKANDTKVITKEVIKYVDKVKIVDSCSTVSDDIMQLLNKAVNDHRG